MTSSHGFEFSTDGPLLGMRSSADRPPVVVTRSPVSKPEGGIEVGRWPEIPGKRAEVSILEVDRKHFVTVGTMARFEVDSATLRIVCDYTDGLPPMIQTTTLFSSPIALCLTGCGKLALHAGAVELDGKAILLAAPGTGGKTTLAAAFHMAGHRVLSDDLVGVDPAGWVEPAPALLRLRYDAADHVAGTLSDTNLRLDDAGKRFYEIAARRRGDGAAVPLSAIVFLAWNSDAAISLRPLAPSAALQSLWPLSFYLKRPGASQTFERLSDLVDRVPAFVLRRPRNFAKLGHTVETIEKAIAQQ